MANEVRFCAKCGECLPDDAVFCGNCGARTVQSEIPVGAADIGEKSNVYQGRPMNDEKTYMETSFNASTGVSSDGINLNPQPKKKNTGLIIGIIASVVFVLMVIGAVAEKMAQNSSNSDISHDIDIAAVTKPDTDASDASKILEDLENGNFETEERTPATEFELGTVTGGTYENRYFGIKCDLVGWTYTSREELAANADIAGDFETDEELIKQLEDTDVFMDMQAFHPNGFTNVNVTVQNSTVGVMNERIVMNAMVEEMSRYFANMGVALDHCEVLELNVNGTTKYGLYLAYNMEGMNINSIQFMSIKPERNGVLTITGSSKEECLSICDLVHFS